MICGSVLVGYSKLGNTSCGGGECAVDVMCQWYYYSADQEKLGI